MIIWVDAQLSPALAPWLKDQFGVDTFSARYLQLVHAKDRQIFSAARDANVVVLMIEAGEILVEIADRPSRTDGAD